MLAFLLLAAAPAAAGGPKEYLEELIRQAAEERLAEEREWHLLLHYRRNFTGGVTSEVDDPSFFLAPTGKTDPQAELEATLAQFFSAAPLGRLQQPAQCAFIARYHWLKARLAFDDRRLRPFACERFEAWLGELNPRGVSMIFPSAYLNNPASMFGHTFLRVDQQGQTDQTRLLAYTINFAADAPGEMGLLYALNGIFGGFKGFFSTLPYYVKVQEYRDIENRDIWEYRLNLTDAQLRRLLMHAWEVATVWIDYYFFKENCSYQLLWLLEYANPDWHLVDHFAFWTVPADTIRVLVQQPGLVGEVVYRPARSTQIQRKRATLSAEERPWLGRLVEEPAVARSEDFARLPVERQAFLLDLASDVLRYKAATDESRAKTYKDRNRDVLVARSGLRIASPAFSVTPFTEPPEQGHKTSRAGLGLGWRNGDFFQDLSLRAGYHDLLDPEPGYNPDAQIEVLAASVRHYSQRHQSRLEKLTVANILSLSPRDEVFRSPSWKVSGGWETVTRPTCRYCGNANVNGGLGAAVESRLWRREVYFAFAEADANYSHAYEANHRIGGGGTVGLLATLSDRWKLLVSTTYLRYPLGERSDDFRWFFGTRYTLHQNLALRVEYHRRYDDSQAVFYIQAFF